MHPSFTHTSQSNSHSTIQFCGDLMQIKDEVDIELSSQELSDDNDDKDDKEDIKTDKGEFL